MQILFQKLHYLIAYLFVSFNLCITGQGHTILDASVTNIRAQSRLISTALSGLVLFLNSGEERAFVSQTAEVKGKVSLKGLKQQLKKIC